MGFSIGDLVGTIGLDDSEFRTVMARTQRGVQTLDANLRRASQSIQQGVSAGINGPFQIVHQNFAKAATESTKTVAGFKRVEHALGTMAIGAAGLNPHLGRLSLALAALGPESLVITGAIAAAGLLGLAWEHGKDKADAYAKSVQNAVDQIKLLGQSEGIPGFDMRQKIATAQARIAEIRGEPQFQSGFAQLQRLKGRVQAGETEIQPAVDALFAKLAPQLNEIAVLQTGIRVAFEQIDQEADEFKDHLVSLNFTAKEKVAAIEHAMSSLALSFAERGGDLFDTSRNNRAPDQRPRKFDLLATGAVRGPFGSPMPSAAFADFVPAGTAVRKIVVPPLEQMTTAVTRVKHVTDKLGDYLDSFSDGLKGVVRDLFGGSDTAKLNRQNLIGGVGASLAGAGITAAAGFVAGKLFDGLKGLFSGVDKLAEAMERNTKALTAGAEFLKKRVQASGLGELAGKTAQGVDELLNQLAVGMRKAEDIPTLLYEFIASFVNPEGMSEGELEQLKRNVAKLAAALGIDISQLNEDTLRQFAEQLGKLGLDLGDLGETARKTSEALRNVPSGFKIALRTFQAVEGRVMAGGAGGASVQMHFAPGAINVDARTKSVDEALEETLRLQARRQSRGGGGGYQNRGPA